MRVLILGGTSEARELAARLGQLGVSVVSSLAGRVSNPALPVGEVRLGGFGGVDGLAGYLLTEPFDALIDATHPFAATITAHAAEATGRTGVPLVVLRRPGWTSGDGDRWQRVPTIEAAAAAATTAAHAATDGSIFLTTGRRDLAAFAGDGEHAYLVRTVEPPDPPVPPRMTLVLDRGPYTLNGELALMREHHVTVLVTKDSGGALTSAKLAAARELGLPVIMVDRPALPPGVLAVDSVDAVLRRLGSGGA